MARILVVERAPSVGVALSRELRPLGHQVVSTNDARQGLAAVSRRRHDLVMLDVGMPEMHALEFVSRLSSGDADRPAPRVVLLAGRQDAMSGLEDLPGVAGILRKPLLSSEIHEVVARATVGLDEVRVIRLDQPDHRAQPVSH